MSDARTFSFSSDEARRILAQYVVDKGLHPALDNQDVSISAHSIKKGKDLVLTLTIEPPN